jgi:hypothetical protein
MHSRGSDFQWYHIIRTLALNECSATIFDVMIFT